MTNSRPNDGVLYLILTAVLRIYSTPYPFGQAAPIEVVVQSEYAEDCIYNTLSSWFCHTQLAYN